MGKLDKIFRFIYSPYLGCGGILYEQHSSMSNQNLLINFAQNVFSLIFLLLGWQFSDILVIEIINQILWKLSNCKMLSLSIVVGRKGCRFNSKSNSRFQLSHCWHKLLKEHLILLIKKHLMLFGSVDDKENSVHA